MIESIQLHTRFDSNGVPTFSNNGGKPLISHLWIPAGVPNRVIVWSQAGSAAYSPSFLWNTVSLIRHGNEPVLCLVKKSCLNQIAWVKSQWCTVMVTYGGADKWASDPELWYFLRCWQNEPLTYSLVAGNLRHLNGYSVDATVCSIFNQGNPQ